MGKYTVKRIINMIPLLFVISIIIFLFIHLIPGDPARQIAGPTATIGEVDEIRNQLGLNQPLVPQYIKWITGIFTGNFGVSYANKTTVIALLAPRLPITIYLTIYLVCDHGYHHRRSCRCEPRSCVRSYRHGYRHRRHLAA